MPPDGARPPLAPHEHEWRLRAVDFEDARSVHSFECVRCLQTEFRSS